MRSGVFMTLARHLISGFAHIVLLIRHLAAENLFLRKQLALLQERQAKPYRATDATRFRMVLLGRFFDWRSALVVVQPGTLIR